MSRGLIAKPPVEKGQLPVWRIMVLTSLTLAPAFTIYDVVVGRTFTQAIGRAVVFVVATLTGCAIHRAFSRDTVPFPAVLAGSQMMYAFQETALPFWHQLSRSVVIAILAVAPIAFFFRVCTTQRGKPSTTDSLYDADVDRLAEQPVGD